MVADKTPQPSEGAAAAAAAAASRRDRSPNYPAITYSEAEAHARKLWDADKQHPMTKDVASIHLGYKKTSGATMPLFAAMKRYGLLESVGTDLKVTKDAHVIFVYPEGSPERTAMRKKLAMLPPMFGEVLQKFDGDLPSDATLKAKLQTDFKFASPEAAETFIEALKEAVAIAGGSTVADPVLGMDNNGDSIKEVAVMNTTQTTISQTLPSQRTSVVPVVPSAPMGHAGHNTEAVTRRWEISADRFASVALPPDPTVEDVTIVEEFLAILKQELALVWKRKARAIGAQPDPPPMESKESFGGP